MQPLAPPDSFRLEAAVGWAMLGNFSEATAELNRLSAAASQHPDVWDARWSILAGQELWDEALTVARQLLDAMPERASGWIHQAFALRRATGGGLAEAFAALHPVADKFPSEPIIPYNLACYACQMGKTDEALTWFKRALRVAKSRGDPSPLLRMALMDPDLEPIRDNLRKRLRDTEEPE